MQRDLENCDLDVCSSLVERESELTTTDVDVMEDDGWEQRIFTSGDFEQDFHRNLQHDLQRTNHTWSWGMPDNGFKCNLPRNHLIQVSKDK